MRIVSLTVGIDSEGPWLALQNDGSEQVRVTLIALQRGNAGAGPYLLFNPDMQIAAGEPWQSTHVEGRFTSNPSADSASQWLHQALRRIVGPNEEAVIRVRVDLEPPHGDRDQLAPSFFVVRMQNSQLTEFFPLLGSLQGQPSLLEALLESRRHGA